MKKYFLLFLAISSALIASAQVEQNVNVFRVSLGGGLQSMTYSPIDADYSVGMGALLGATYEHFFTDQIAIDAGIEFSSLHSSADYNHSRQYGGVVLPGANYPATVTERFDNFKEVQNLFQVSIPVLFVYRLRVDGSPLHLGAGLQLNIPFVAKYKPTEGTVRRTAYMEQFDITFDDMPNHKLGTVKATDLASGKFATRVNLAAVVDASYLVYANENLALEVGLYASYAFLPVMRSPSQPIFDGNYDYQGMVNSSLVDRAGAVQVGLKLGLSFGLDAAPKAAEPLDGQEAMLGR